MKFFSTMIVLALQASPLLAGVCEIKTTRVACAGKETESFKKCDGKAECSSKKKAATAEECQALAVKECENSRVEVTKSKVINAKFDGKELNSAAGKANYCDDNRPDFNKCK